MRTKIIDVPNLLKLGLMDGLMLAESEIKPLHDDILADQVKIVLLFPEDRMAYSTADGSSTIMADFYTGLLEDLLIAMRDKKFPDLKALANRDRIFVVKEADKKPDEVMKIVKGMFKTAWETYDPLEKYFMERFSIGIRHRDGSYSLAEFSPGRVMEGTRSTTHDNLFRYAYKMFKALDASFTSNLTMISILRKNPELAVTSTPTANPV